MSSIGLFSPPIIAASVAEDSNFGQPRAGSAREAILRPHHQVPYGVGWGGATMRDTQADVPSA